MIERGEKDGENEDINGGNCRIILSSIGRTMDRSIDPLLLGSVKLLLRRFVENGPLLTVKLGAGQADSLPADQDHREEGH